MEPDELEWGDDMERGHDSRCQTLKTCHEIIRRSFTARRHYQAATNAGAVKPVADTPAIIAAVIQFVNPSCSDRVVDSGGSLHGFPKFDIGIWF
jgi:hypothetical protein